MDKQILSSLLVRAIAIALAALCSTTFLDAARAANSLADPWSPADATDEAAYRKTIKEGVTEYAARHFEEARSLFRRAHEMSPNARTFRGIGMTSFELRDYVLAVRNLSAALRDEHKPLSAEQRKDTQDLLDRSRLFVDVYKLTVSPRDAHVVIDSRVPEFESDGTLLLGFGAHTVEASAQGMTARSLVINVRGGERKDISLTLERVPPAIARPVGVGAAQAGAAKKPTPVSPSNGAAAAWLWASGGTALLAAGAGIYWWMQNSELKSCRNPPSAGLRCTDESSIKTQWNVGLGATLGTGAAALTMAIIGILSWDSGRPPASKHSALDCTVGPFGVTCAGSF
jgi:tetratricopeptide (TPR) repeat protein